MFEPGVYRILQVIYLSLDCQQNLSKSTIELHSIIFQKETILFFLNKSNKYACYKKIWTYKVGPP
jgi:hypothetical protein